MNKWRYIKEDQVSADYGLAVDEFLMDAYNETEDKSATLRLYTYNDYAALVGRFQNINAELDLERCRELGFQYNRRLTGGGAIIMGHGQLGLCLATKNTFECDTTRELYTKFSMPLILALQDFGIDAKLRGKNDLEVDGKKIAGLGIHINPQGSIQFHTSLLVDLDIEVMLDVLNIPLQKIRDKAHIYKVEQRITTVSRELNRSVSIEEVRKKIKMHFEEYFEIELCESTISDEENIQISEIVKHRYQDENWVFQSSPQDDMTGMSLKKTSVGLLRCYVALIGETIKSVLITGDFTEQEELFKNIEAQLKWSPLDRSRVTKTIHEVFEKFDASEGITEKEILDAIWLASMGAMKEVKYNYNGSCYYPKKQIV